jgi:hypothetical protein
LLLQIIVILHIFPQKISSFLVENTCVSLNEAESL